MRYISGFEKKVNRLQYSIKAKKALPATIDRFYESHYFALQIAELNPIVSNSSKANWFLSAYFSAVMSIREAVELDVKLLGYNKAYFNGLSIAKESYLPSDGTNVSENDPLSVNRIFRDIRNLRVHFAIPLVSLVDGKWRLNDVSQEYLSNLRNARVSEGEAMKFNSFILSNDLIKLLFQHLYIQGQLISETNEKLKA